MKAPSEKISFEDVDVDNIKDILKLEMNRIITMNSYDVSTLLKEDIAKSVSEIKYWKQYCCIDMKTSDYSKKQPCVLKHEVIFYLTIEIHNIWAKIIVLVQY